MGCCGDKKKSLPYRETASHQALKSIKAQANVERSENLLRESCIKCACKHISQARALLIESETAYPVHYWYAMGHLAEAEEELYKDYPDLMIMVRAERIQLEIDRSYRIDFNALITALVKIDDESEQST